MNLQLRRIHLKQKAVMSSMMSLMWLVMLVKLVSTSSISTASGLLGITAMSSVLAKHQRASDSHIISAQSNAIQSAGLLVSQVSISSGLVASNNASFLPTPSLFALSDAANTVPSFMHHVLTSKPIAMQLSSSLLSNSPIRTRFSSSSLSFAAIETVVSRQDEHSSERKVISTNTPFILTATAEESVVLFPSLTIISGDASRFIIESATTHSDMFGTQSTLELKTTDSSILVSLAPSPSSPIFNTASSLHAESTSNKATASSSYTSHQILPSFDMYSETLGLPTTTTLSGSYQSRTSERRIWSFKTPSFISSDQLTMPLESVSPATSYFSLNSVGLSNEQRPLHTSYFGSESQTSEVVAMATPVPSTFKVPILSVSNELLTVQSSRFESTGQTTEVITIATPASGFYFPMPSVSFQSLFLPNLPDISPSDDAVTIATSYQTRASSNLATEQRIAGSLYGSSESDKIQPSSRRLLAVTSETVPMTTSSLTYPTLDRSFSTNLYWLKLDITVPEYIDIKQRDFIITMETSLATAYSEGKNRMDERQVAVQELLGKLNPDNDPLMNIRNRRAVTIDGNTAQVIDLSRNIIYPVNVEMVFYIAEGESTMLAVDSKAIFNELTLQEMTFYLQVVVKSFPVEFIEPVVITTTPAPSLDFLWIILGVLGGCALIFCGCCCCFCIFCRRPLKPSRDGPMDIDTLKMLQYKEKYPYKTYKTPNQTPRGFDVAKETDGTMDTGVANEAGGSGSGNKLQSSGTGSMLKNPLSTVNTPRLDVDPYSSSSSPSNLSLSGKIPEVPPLELKSLQDSEARKSTDDNEEDAFHQAASWVDLSASGRSQRSTGMYQPRLLPLRTQTSHEGDHWSHKSVHKSASSKGSSQSLLTSREADELRRIYHEAQREITRVLEPDIIPDQSDLTYVPPDRRTKLRGKFSKRRKAEMETEFGGKTSDHTLPDTHYARKTSKKQIAARRQPEALQEARRKVHNLIDEAFSLVGLPKNVVSPAPPLSTITTPIATNTTPIVEDGEEQTSKVKDNKSLFQRTSNSAASSSAEGKGYSRMLGEQGTRVVVIPVTHQADKIADIVWNPYNAEDELAQLQKSQQLTSVSGGVELTYRPHQIVSHLTMPHPVSVPETPEEPYLKGIATPQHAGEIDQSPNQRRLSKTHDEESVMDNTMDDRQRTSTSLRWSSTRLRRPSTDSDTKLHNTTPNDPYLDPYLKRSFNEDLNGTFILSPHLDGLSTTEEDPYVMALSKSSKDLGSAKPSLGLKQQCDTDMLSTLSKERKVGKPIADGYDEFDISRNLNSKDNSGQLVAAIREELVRLAKRSGQHGSSS